MIRDRLRRRRAEAYPPDALAAQALHDAALLRESERRLRVELSTVRTQLAAERRNVERLQGENRAGAAMVAGAGRACAETCPHAAEVERLTAERERGLNHPGSCAHQRLYSQERSRRGAAEAHSAKLEARLAETTAASQAADVDPRGFVAGPSYSELFYDPALVADGKARRVRRQQRGAS